MACDGDPLEDALGALRPLAGVFAPSSVAVGEGESRADGRKLPDEIISGIGDSERAGDDSREISMSSSSPPVSRVAVGLMRSMSVRDNVPGNWGDVEVSGSKGAELTIIAVLRSPGIGMSELPESVALPKRLAHIAAEETPLD